MEYEIITKHILNPETGKIETKDFKATKEKSRIRGGFRMTYAKHDEILKEICNSSKDIEVFLRIRDTFTHQRIESPLPARDIAKELNTSPSKVSTIIKKMIEYEMLKRVSRGVYRLNPFMFIPYKADAKTLQKEWSEFTNKFE